MIVGDGSLAAFRTQSYELAKDAVRYISRGEDYGPPPSRFEIYVIYWLEVKVKYTNLAGGILDFCKQSSFGPSYAANGQEDDETCTNLKDDTIMVNHCYFDSIVQYPSTLRNVQVYCAMSEIKIDPGYK